MPILDNKTAEERTVIREQEMLIYRLTNDINTLNEELAKQKIRIAELESTTRSTP
jgi:hypothetical protein